MRSKSLVFAVGLIVLLASCAVFSTVPRASADIIITTSDDLGPYGTNERGFNTIYQNTTGKPFFIAITILVNADASDGVLYVSPSSPPDKIMAHLSCASLDIASTLCAIVPNGYYYKLWGAFEIWNWIEQTLEDNYLTGPQGPPGENGTGYVGVVIRKNDGENLGPYYGRINLVEGDNILIAVENMSENGEYRVTITSTGIGGSGDIGTGASLGLMFGLIGGICGAMLWKKRNGNSQ